jgi:hypothetical protein
MLQHAVSQHFFFLYCFSDYNVRSAILTILCTEYPIMYLMSNVLEPCYRHNLLCLAYSSSKGSIRLIDMRQSALCDSHAKL